MKTLKNSVSVLLVTIGIAGSAQNVKTTYQCNFDCPSCEEKVMKNIPYEKGVKAVEVDYENKLVTIEYKAVKNNEINLQVALEKLGYHTQIIGAPTSFGVKGNCGMCKEKIESAAKSIDGVSLASWDAASQKLSFYLNNSSTRIETIHNAIANAGYDTDLVKSNDENYNNLHSCCKYER